MASKLTVLSITPVLSIRGGIWAGLYLKNCPVSRHSYNSYHPCKFTGAWLKRRLAQAGIEAVVLKLSGTNSKQNKEMVMEMFRTRWVRCFLVPVKGTVPKIFFLASKVVLLDI